MIQYPIKSEVHFVQNLLEKGKNIKFKNWFQLKMWIYRKVDLRPLIWQMFLWIQIVFKLTWSLTWKFTWNYFSQVWHCWLIEISEIEKSIFDLDIGTFNQSQKSIILWKNNWCHLTSLKSSSAIKSASMKVWNHMKLHESTIKYESMKLCMYWRWLYQMNTLWNSCICCYVTT